MKNRFTAGMLALFLGTFWVHKLYLGRKKECFFNVLFFWTFVPMLAGLVEAANYAWMTKGEWEDYCSKIQSPDWYKDPMALWAYIVPAGIAALLLWIGLMRHPPFNLLSLLILPAIWLVPAKGERIFQNRPIGVLRIIATVLALPFISIALLAGSWNQSVRPEISLKSDPIVSQTGGTYQLEFKAIPSESATVWGNPAQSLGSGSYAITVPLTNPKNAFQVEASYEDRIFSETFVIERMPTEQEAEAARLVEAEAVRTKAAAEEASKLAEVEAEKAKVQEAERKRQERIKDIKGWVDSYRNSPADNVSYYEADEGIINNQLAGFKVHLEDAVRAKNDPDKEIQKLGAAYERAIIDKQKVIFPRIRAAYAKILGKRAWVDDGKVNVGGQGNTQLTIINWRYANNRAILNDYSNLKEILVKYRFKEVNFKWADTTYGEYTRSELKESLPDSAPVN